MQKPIIITDKMHVFENKSKQPNYDKFTFCNYHLHLVLSTADDFDFFSVVEDGFDFFSGVGLAA